MKNILGLDLGTNNIEKALVKHKKPYGVRRV